MLNAFLSVWHVDLLVWCQLVLVGVIALGTFVLTIGGTRAHRSELSVTIAGLVAVIATLFTDNLAVLVLAFALSVISATCLDCLKRGNTIHPRCAEVPRDEHDRRNNGADNSHT